MHASNVHVCEVMTPDPVTVKTTETVVAASKVMLEYEVGLLPVYNGSQLKGVITDRDIVLRWVAKDRDAACPVGEIMSPDIFSIDPGDDIVKAVEVMEKNRVRRLIVIDRRGQTAGIISKTEILTYLTLRL